MKREKEKKKEEKEIGEGKEEEKEEKICLSWATQFAKLIMWIASSKHHINPMNKLDVTSFYTWRHWGSEQLYALPTLTHPSSGNKN